MEATLASPIFGVATGVGIMLFDFRLIFRSHDQQSWLEHMRYFKMPWDPSGLSLLLKLDNSLNTHGRLP